MAAPPAGTVVTRGKKHGTPYSEQEMKTYRFLKKSTPAARNSYVAKLLGNPEDPKKVAAAKRIMKDYPKWFDMRKR